MLCITSRALAYMLATGEKVSTGRMYTRAYDDPPMLGVFYPTSGFAINQDTIYD